MLTDAPSNAVEFRSSNDILLHLLAQFHKVGAESAVDINLAKQLNVLIGQVGVNAANIVMNVGTAAAGYGFEYVVSAMDRIEAAALSQNDNMLQKDCLSSQ